MLSLLLTLITGLVAQQAAGPQALPDGGLLISDYTCKRLLEVGAEGKLVHDLATGNWGVASVSLAR